MKKVTLFAALVLLCVGAPAFAAMNEGEKEIGVGFGQTSVDDDLGIDSATHYAVRGGYAINDRIQIEGQFSSASDDGMVGATPVDTKMNLIMVNGMWNFHPRDHITPFVLVGLGRSDVEVELGGTTVDDNGLAYQFGGGSRFFFGKQKKAAFRFDVSLVSEDSFDDSSTHMNATAGFTWRFGN